MDISHLKEFVVLAETGNFLDAADLLNSSQSTLSKHIKKIEMELGIPLFERTTRKVNISKYGLLLLPYARQIVELQQQYSTDLHNAIETDQEILTVGSIPALAQYNIVDILINFKKSRSRTVLNVMQAGSAELKEALRQKKCDLAFIRFADEVDDDLVQMPFATDTLAAVLPVNHPLAGQETVPLGLLAGEDFLMIEKQSYLFNLCVNACRKSGFEPKIAFTDHKVGILIDMVVGGMGVALLMKRLALYANNPKTSIVDIQPTLSTQLSLCYLKGLKLTDSANHFLRCAGF